MAHRVLGGGVPERWVRDMATRGPDVQGGSDTSLSPRPSYPPRSNRL